MATTQKTVMVHFIGAKDKRLLEASLRDAQQYASNVQGVRVNPGSVGTADDALSQYIKNSAPWTVIYADSQCLRVPQYLRAVADRLPFRLVVNRPAQKGHSPHPPVVYQIRNRAMVNARWWYRHNPARIAF